jgi:Rieske Fe-S protein
MSGNSPISRRGVLAAGIAGAGAAVVAACGGSGGSSGGGGSGGGGNAQAKAGEKVISLSKVQVGSSASARIGGDPVLVFRDGQNSAVCFSAICTHQGCTVNPDGTKFECPCHGSVYDARTGKVLQGPAPAPLPQIQVKVHNGEIVTA